MRGAELVKVEAAWGSGDFETANVTVGESIGLIDDLPGAGALVERIAAQAGARLSAFARAG